MYVVLPVVAHIFVYIFMFTCIILYLWWLYQKLEKEQMGWVLVADFVKPSKFEIFFSFHNKISNKRVLKMAKAEGS